MFSKRSICALDIGSSKISVAVARLAQGKIAEVFFESIPSCGLRRGSVVDSIELVKALGSLFKKIRNNSGIQIKYVYANIAGEDISARHSHAIIPLAERGNKVITSFDVEKANLQARILGSNMEDEIIAEVPFGYAIDNKADIVNPIGLYSHRLQVDLYLICARLSCLQNLTGAISQAGLDLKEVFYSGMITSKLLFEEKMKQGLSIFCDIGSDITQLVILENGMLKEVHNLPIGGDDITLAISKEIGIPYSLAEEVKKTYGSIYLAASPAVDKEILIKRDNIYKPISHKLIVDVVTNSAKCLLEEIKKNAFVNFNSNQVTNFVLYGGTVLQEGFLEKAESVFSFPVQLARVSSQRVSSLINHPKLSGMKYLGYLTCLGILVEVLENDKLPGFIFPHDASRKPLQRLVDQAKALYLEYF
ncbi:MAG: cell division protein FtsA [Candidatus Omnitrophica bacterium]|jgi:cell division protein FtsA|nr:cell division protein FtsA [Candidatus Omnitrophota bacterium]